MLWAASEEVLVAPRVVLGSPGRQQHVSLGWPLTITNPLPCPFLHSFAMVVAIFDISFDLEIDDDFCLKSWAAAHHWCELYHTYDGWH